MSRPDWLYGKHGALTQPTVYNAGHPDGRPATPHEIAAVLGQHTAADGTSYLDMWRDSQAQEQREIAEATAAANAACRAFIDSGDATYAERSKLTDTYRTALNRLRELNGGHLPRLDALHED